MTPAQYIKAKALVRDLKWRELKIPKITPDNIDSLYIEFDDGDEYQDALSEIREGDYKTNIPCEGSIHYESYSVAMKTLDGKYIGWTYWYGGGKHAEPEAIDWIESAYFLECKKEEVMTIKRTFKKL